jgi:predicted MFS family arabinose efflux permease
MEKICKGKLPMTKKSFVLRAAPAQKALILLTVILFWFSQYIFIPYQTPYLYALSVIPSLVGIIVGAYGFTQMLFRIPIGLMADSIGKHRCFIFIGVFSSGVASLFRAFCPGTAGFLIGSLLSGLAAAMWISFMVLFFGYFNPEELQKAAGLIIGANNLGILIAFITGTILYDRFGMRFLCLLGSAAAVLALASALLIREPRREFRGLPMSELTCVFRDRRLILFALLALIQQGIQVSTSMSFTTQVAKSRGADGSQIGVCSILYILVAVLSSCAATTKAFRRIRVSIWIPAILDCLTIYCLLVPNLPSVGWIDAAQVLSGLSTGILFSLCTSEAMKNVPPEKHSSAMGFFQAVYALGMTLFPILTGTISSRFGIRTAFYCLAAIAVFGLITAVGYYRLHPSEK